MLCQKNSAERVKAELGFGDNRHVISRNQIHEIKRTSKSGSFKGTKISSCKPHRALDYSSEGNGCTYEDSPGIQRNDTISSKTECSKYGSDGGKTHLSSDIRTVQDSSIPGLANVKTEPPNYEEYLTSNVNTLDPMLFRNFVLVKSEVQTAGDGYEDELDHLSLRERMKLLSSRNGSSLYSHRTAECMEKVVPSAVDCRPVVSEPAHTLKVNRSRKRRKTVT